MSLPRMLSAPRVQGVAQPGERLFAEPGTWQGAEALDLQWCLDGAPIPGETGASCLIGDDMDGGQIALRVTARAVAGNAAGESAPLPVQSPPPELLPLVLDDVLDATPGMAEIPVAHAFRGKALRFSVRGEGVRVDSRTGCVSVPTARPHPGMKIRVEARNSGGAAELLFTVAVEDEIGLAETRTVRELTVDGVSFRFDRPVEIGHFVTGAAGEGDPFVIGPVTLLDYSPPRRTLPDGRSINGAMLNPPCTEKSGFDSDAPHHTYEPELDAGARLPLDLVPGDSLIVAVSQEKREKKEPMTDHFVILTCLAEPPFADSFRPPYSGPEKPLYRLSDVDPDRLAELPVIARGLAPDPAELRARFDRFALDFIPQWNRGAIASRKHPPVYGRGLCDDQAAPLLWVNSNRPDEEKWPLIAGLIQRGIDRHGVVLSAKQQDMPLWTPDGGHNSGRKVTILFAGALLGVDEMLRVSSQTVAPLQEDGMTFYVTQEIVDLSNGPDWAPSYGDKNPQQPYEPGMIGMPEWRGKLDPAKASASWIHNPYRISGTNNTQHGQVLAMLAMGLRDEWGHDAYFDYHMRFVEIMRGAADPWRFQGQRRILYQPVLGSRPEDGWDGWQIFWRDRWSYEMLMTYRSKFYRFPWA